MPSAPKAALKRCAHCRSEFAPIRPSNIYCCARCADRAYRATNPHGGQYRANLAERKCALCETKFAPVHRAQIYCSRLCAGRVWAASHQAQIKEYRERNRTQTNERNRVYMRKNYDRFREARAAYRAANRETIRARNRLYMRTYNKEHRDQIERYRQENAEKIRIYRAKYIAEHREARNEKNRLYMQRYSKENHAAIRAAAKEFRQKNRERLLLEMRQRVIDLHPGYVRMLIAQNARVPTANIPTELIAPKREQVLLHRQLLETKHAISSKDRRSGAARQD